MMRIGTWQFHQSISLRMSRMQSEISDLQGQISTGKRILTPSDDPVGSQRLAQLQARSADSLQFRRNMDVANRNLALSDSAVDSMINRLMRAREITLTANNDSYSDSDRQSFAAELASLEREIFAIANTRDINGDYVFAGSNAMQPAFTRDLTGAAVWQGSAPMTAIPVSPDAAVVSREQGATLLTLETGTGRQSVFAILTEARSNVAEPLATPDDRAAWHDRLSASLETMDQAIQKLTTARASIGARMAQVENTQSLYDRTDLALETERTSLESLDMASAITQLQSALLILQATQESYVKIRSLSLFDALR
jgi:flagellar hook-associated protein 3 FlgL